MSAPGNPYKMAFDAWEAGRASSEGYALKRVLADLSKYCNDGSSIEFVLHIAERAGDASRCDVHDSPIRRALEAAIVARLEAKSDHMHQWPRWAAAEEASLAAVEYLAASSRSRLVAVLVAHAWEVGCSRCICGHPMKRQSGDCYREHLADELIRALVGESA